MEARNSNVATARRRIGVPSRATAMLIGVVAAASLVIPAAAFGTVSSGYAVPPDQTGSDQANASTATATTPPGNGFDWGDALIGAGAAFGIVAVGGAGVTLRRHRAVGPALSGS